MKAFFQRYGIQPTSFADVDLMMDVDIDASADETKIVSEKIRYLASMKQTVDEQLLTDEVEKFFKIRALENAILESVEIIQDEKLINKGIIADKIKAALSVQFKIEIGHDYFADTHARMTSYFEEEDLIPLDIDGLNFAMGGGLHKKALMLFCAPPKRGKTLWMCHCAASAIKAGKNVLYVTMEMSEKSIARRIDANVLDIEMSQLNMNLDKNIFKSRFRRVCEQLHGELNVKQYPTGAFNSYQLTALLKEIKTKKGYIPEVVILDYINICSSSRLAASVMANGYLYKMAICEEMRGVAVEFNLSLLSSVQNNRGSIKKTTDSGMDDLADSFGIAMTADWMGIIIQTDELREQKKYLLKVSGSRFDEITDDIISIGVDYSKMRLFNLGKEEQEIPLHVKDQLAYAKNKNKTEEEVVLFDFGDD